MTGSKLKLWMVSTTLNTLRPRQNGHRFADDTFKRIFLNENVRILIKISLKFVPKGPINNIPALVQIMAWRRSGDKPLSEPMMVNLPTHICVTRPQWVKAQYYSWWMMSSGLNPAWDQRQNNKSRSHHRWVPVPTLIIALQTYHNRSKHGCMKSSIHWGLGPFW